MEDTYKTNCLGKSLPPCYGIQICEWWNGIHSGFKTHRFGIWVQLPVHIHWYLVTVFLGIQIRLKLVLGYLLMESWKGRFEPYRYHNANMAELVYAEDLKSLPSGSGFDSQYLHTIVVF